MKERHRETEREREKKVRRKQVTKLEGGGERKVA